MKKYFAILMCFVLVACSSNKPPVPQVPEHTPVAASSPDAPVYFADPVATPVGNLVLQHAEVPLTPEVITPVTVVAPSVYFDFDDYAIKPEYRELVAKYAEVIKERKLVVVLVGNADERGSAEYNVALASKRAKKVRDALVILGVNADSIIVLSNGDTVPRLTCHDESCWHENRRVDFSAK